MGDLLRSEKRWDEAISIYESILEHNAAYWQAYIGLGWAKYERGDGLAEALTEFQKAIAIPESKGNGQFAIAQVFTREKQYQQAEDWYSQALALNPEAKWWWLARANALRSSGELSKAIPIYLMAIEKFPQFSPLYYDIAWAYKLNQQLTEAAQYIEKAIALMETPNLGYYVRAGNIYEEMGEKKSASSVSTGAANRPGERKCFTGIGKSKQLMTPSKTVKQILHVHRSQNMKTLLIKCA